MTVAQTDRLHAQIEEIFREFGEAHGINSLSKRFQPGRIMEAMALEIHYLRQKVRWQEGLLDIYRREPDDQAD